jgi:hypothetical protein
MIRNVAVNHGDYIRAVLDRNVAENITRCGLFHSFSIRHNPKQASLRAPRQA